VQKKIRKNKIQQGGATVIKGCAESKTKWKKGQRARVGPCWTGLLGLVGLG